MNPANDKPIKYLAYAAVVASVLALLAVPFFLREEKESVVYEKFLMGTLVEITIMEGEEERFDGAAQAAFAEIARLEEVFSSYKPESEVSMVSKNAGGGPVEVSAEVLYVVEEALRVSRLSGGAFDPTIGALSGVWGFSGERGYVPESSEVEALLPLVDFREVMVDKSAKTVGLNKKGMTLNLGGIAKGYIVGSAAKVLEDSGVERGIIKAGGDMFVFQSGVERRQRPFVIGIKHPRQEGGLLGEVYVKRGAVATSGDYERFFVEAGVRYHHILDPGTGFPARATRSVTVIAEDPTLADALSTAVFVMGPEKGLALIEAIEGAEAVVVDSEGRVHASRGFDGKVF